jgi:hypothetical protein
MQTVVHVTHEAVQKIGGIGAVLHGLLTSPVYLDAVQRNILVGTFWPSDDVGENRLGSDGEVIYSSLDHLFNTPLASRFHEIERVFDVRLVYGRKRFHESGTNTSSFAEVLLIDVRNFDSRRLADFKFKLWERFGVDSSRYEHIFDYEQWVRVAEPAIACLHALGAANESDPCVILAHEYMGLPTALAAVLDEARLKFRTIFYAHEVATMRRIVEHHPGYDLAFYNAMRLALPAGKYVEDVFGSQSDYYKHALVKSARFCDGIFAVGDFALKEVKFLGEDFIHVDSQLAYNGVPCWKIDTNEKARSRNKLRKYCENLLRFQPDHVLTHVTRMVPSKAMWRDIRVLEHLEPQLRKRNESAVLFVLSTEVPGRRGDDIRRMESLYRWPVAHREGLPDLSHGEAHFYQWVQEFNACSRNIKIVYINQFGFDRRTCGERMPVDMEFMDIRKGSDVEFGQSIYEPFGIAQVEPISFGGICVFSNVCGCAGFVDKAAGNKPTANVIVADYTAMDVTHARLEQILKLTAADREGVEHRVAERVAQELADRLPRSPAEFEGFIARGYELASKMSWDTVARQYVIPGIQRAAHAQRISMTA